MLCGWDGAIEGFVAFEWANFPEHVGLFDAQVRFENGRNHMFVEVGARYLQTAARCAADVAAKVLAEAGLAAADVDAIVAAPLAPEFLDVLADALGAPRDRMPEPPAKRSHTAATLVALDALLGSPPVTDARTILFVAAGAGITAGAALYRR